MSAVLNFDASQVAPDTGSQDALPAGWYNVLMESSEMKPTKDGTGAYLECKFNVIDGAHANKKVYGRLNLRNANPIAQEIGYKQLSAICHAVGILQVQDSAQLHNLPLKIKLKLRKPDGEYEASNEITAFKNINEQVAMAGVGGFPNQAAPASFAPPAAPAFAVPPVQQFAQPAQQFAAPAPQFAPGAAPVAQAPAAAPAWQPPAAQQPWQAPAQAPQQAPQAPAQASAPAWNPNQQPQQAPVQQAPVQPQQPVQQYAPAPVQQPVQQQPIQQAPVNTAPQQAAVPPWMQQAPQQA